jgi:FKBP-type peptidyl-prolyl cis-trans isomerase
MQKSLLLAVCVSLFSCSETHENNQKVDNSASLKSLEKANRYLVRTENEDIENYIRRHRWTMQKTGSGLQIMIFKNGSGERASKGKIAVLNYKTWLLNGDLIYSSDQFGQKNFKIGKGGVESGLEEAILLMRVGDKANLIIPSHLAFGLLGDENKIPPRATLIYELELVSLK